MRTPLRTRFASGIAIVQLPYSLSDIRRHPNLDRDMELPTLHMLLPTARGVPQHTDAAPGVRSGGRRITQATAQWPNGCTVQHGTRHTDGSVFTAF